MKLPVITAAIILISFTPLSTVAQEIGYLDLTDNIFRERSRQTRTMGSGCGGSPHSTPDSRSQVTVTVVSLDKTRYRIGEDVTFEIKVMNSGKETIVVPWTPHLGDLEPADTRSSYKYRVGVVLLLFRDPEDHEFPILESLYGALNVAGTLRELAPGEWFTVRGRKKLEFYDQSWGKKGLRESGIVVAKVSGFYRQDRGTYSPKDGGSDSQWCIVLPSQKANQLDVIVEAP